MKFECSCGARFAFEVDPNSGPIEFICPQCGVDSSPLVNRRIREELGLPAAVATPAPEAQPSPPVPRRIDQASAFCLKHPQQEATDRCRVCGKPICPECMTLFGYACSAYCRQKASDTGVTLPAFAGQREQIEARVRHRSRRRWLIATASGGLLLAGWIWFLLIGSKPRVAYSVRFTTPGIRGAARLLEPGQALLLRDQTISRYTPRGKRTWSVKGPEPTELPIPWLPTTSGLWLADQRRLTCLRLTDGQQLQQLDAGGDIIQLRGGDQEVVAQVQTLLGHHLVYRVQGSRNQSQQIDPPASGSDGGVLLGEGSTVVWSAELIRTDSLPEPEKKESTVLDGQVTVGNSMSLASEMIREIQRERSEGSPLGVSINQLTLSWVGSTNWSSELAGQPQLRMVKSGVVVTASTNLLVFNHQGRLLWRQNLAYPVRDLGSFSNRPLLADEERGCCLEEAGVLYLWDQGMLSAFDILSGRAQWRLPHPNITGVGLDDEGMLYANAFDVFESSIGQEPAVRPVIIKIDSRAGRILWRARNRGHFAKATGRFIYSLEWAPGTDRAKPHPGSVPAHLRVYRLDHGDGSICWEHYDNREPVMVDFQRNTMLFLFKDEMQVLKFLTL